MTVCASFNQQSSHVTFKLNLACNRTWFSAQGQSLRFSTIVWSVTGVVPLGEHLKLHNCDHARLFPHVVTEADSEKDDSVGDL